jgi:integrase
MTDELTDTKPKKLTAANLKTKINQPGRHGDPGSGGLYFRVLPGRKGYFVFRYRLRGEEHEMTLGSYPEMKLSEARALHAAARAKVKNQKIDPLLERRAAEEAAKPPSQVPTFGQAADDYVATHAASWSMKHATQWRISLMGDCGPIRSIPVDQVNVEAVLKVLTPLWSRVPASASRLRGRIETVLDAARVRGHIAADKANPARWRGHLDHLLPNPKKVAPPGHHAAMDYADIPTLMAKLSQAPGFAPKALALVILTATRAGEVRGMIWEEVDLDKGTWTIPAARMKARKDHAVPLSDAAVAILRRQQESWGKSVFVFPGARPSKPLSINALAVALERMCEEAVTVHGFRAAFRSWCADKGVAFEVAESALAHTSSSVVEAYQRSAMLERRRPVMQAWANYLGEEPSEKVVSIAGGRRRRS